MSNILILTPLFPSPDYYAERSQDPRTKFLLDYAEAWTRQGHNVRVVHLPPLYPRIFNQVAAVCGTWPMLRTLHLSRFKQNLLAISPKSYSHAGIEIVRHPIAKFIPHRAIPAKRLCHVSSHFARLAKSENWQADFILADYLSPSLSVAIELSNLLKAEIFPIIHQTDLRYFIKSPQAHMHLFSKCTALLFRSASMVERFNNAGLVNNRHDFMYSGLPDGISTGLPRKHISRLLYVGTLRKSKNIHLILYALARLREKYPVTKLDIIGNGEYESILRSLVLELNLSECVTFHGKVPHEEVFEYMRHADALVMVSRESFGMVYIEAMSQGCIVVAAKGEGIDGIVTNNDNGFLVPLNDQQALINTLGTILALPEDEVERISTSAINTSCAMTNDSLASNLLARLNNYRKSINE